MSKQELFKQFLTDRLSAVALEIFGAFEQTIVDFQIEIHRSIEENARLQQRLLNVAKQPEKITLHRADVNQPTLPEIKDERELWTNQAKDSSQLLLIYETPTVENSGDSVPINRTDQIKAEPDGEDYGAPVRDSQSPSIVSPDCRTAQRLRENRRGRYTPTQAEGNQSAPALYPPNKRLKSAVWNFFGYPKQRDGSIHDDGQPICKGCGKRVIARRGNTSNMMSHLRKHHPIHHAQLVKAKVPSRCAREAVPPPPYGGQSRVQEPR